jgi:hypothetical protein
MADLLQIAAFFLGAFPPLGVRSAARPEKTHVLFGTGYRIPDYHGQVIALTRLKKLQAIENDAIYRTIRSEKAEFCAMSKPRA